MAQFLKLALFTLFVCLVVTPPSLTFEPPYVHAGFTLLNYGSQNIIDTVATVEDESDWVDGKSPHENFSKLTVSTGAAASAEADFKIQAESNFFTMVLTFSDSSTGSFRVNFRAVLNDIDPELSSNQTDRTYSAQAMGGHLLITVEDN